MAIIAEDGTIVTGANSYVATADLTTYATARGITLTSGAETLLIQAMDYIESLMYKGVKFTRDQGLQWPRANVVIDGRLFDSDAIPAELIKAQKEVAIAIDQGNGPLINLPRSTKREKVGPLEVEYMDGAASVELNRKITASLWKLLANGGTGSNVLTVSKG